MTSLGPRNCFLLCQEEKKSGADWNSVQSSISLCRQEPAAAWFVGFAWGSHEVYNDERWGFRTAEQASCYREDAKQLSKAAKRWGSHAELLVSRRHKTFVWAACTCCRYDLTFLQHFQLRYPANFWMWLLPWPVGEGACNCILDDNPVGIAHSKWTHDFC